MLGSLGISNDQSVISIHDHSTEMEGQPHCAAKSTKIKSSCPVSHLPSNVEGGAPDMHCSMACVSKGRQRCKG